MARRGRRERYMEIWKDKKSKDIHTKKIKKEKEKESWEKWQG